ncbi:phage portal protein [Mycobacterium terramassiliense]|uniref:Phage portal protein, SPP1 Gp6-like n=1 Tax=Mycobacterium terramassiliense TaxID=1841859 RepID=A0A2U3NJG3_9MYCO|nr:phage portal protein [Mycobacterium terramassiliense]SPM31574.1 Phage portal protein, SPP1 Gp6-like [Mycobacterium terramassiliense]
MDLELLVDLLEALEAPQYRYAELEKYYHGHQSLAFLSPESRAALGERFGRMATNLPRLAIGCLSERLRVTGFSNASVWPLWLANDLDQLSDSAHRDALLFGTSYAVVWANERGNPQVSIESPKQVTVLADPGSREIVAGLKRWTTKTTTEAALYLPDRVIRLRANSLGAVATQFNVVDEMDNPLGVVPVVQLRNAERIPVGAPYYYPERLLDWGWSEVHDLIPLVDGINKLLADMLVSAEYTARPRRWATGIELIETPRVDEDGNPVLDDNNEPIMDVVSPIPEGPRTMWSEQAEAKFGQLDGAALTGYENAVNVLLGQIMAVAALPAHMVGIFTDNPASADALRASESSLTARAESRQKMFGRAWERVGRLMVAVQDGADPDTVDVRTEWCDPATSSAAQEADAVTKLVQAGVLSRLGALRRLGYTEDQIQQELADTAADREAQTDAITKQYHQALMRNEQ